MISLGVVMGNFNEVLHAHEHDGVGQRSQAQMDAFRDALDTCGLSDIGYSGISWTFDKKVTGGTYTRVRLDNASQISHRRWRICPLFWGIKALQVLIIFPYC